MLTAIALLTAWGDERDMDAWLTVADGVDVSGEWELIAASLAEISHRMAAELADYAGVSTEQIVQRIAQTLADEITE
jgi:hypothetical protein